MTYLLVGHQIHYSYTSDRGFIQSVEQDDYRHRLVNALTSGGSVQADRQADTLLFRSVNYEADNLIFADIYAGFCVVSIPLAGLCLLGRLAARRSTGGERTRRE